MSLVARLIDVDRSDRIPIERPGTLRDASQAPVDVIVDNLSATGCLLRLPEAMPVGALVSLGIPGIGIHSARITRVNMRSHGCAFLVPISDVQIALALSSETVITGPFEPLSIQPIGAAEVESDVSSYKLPLQLRVALIVGTSAAMWALLIGVGISIAR